MAEQTRDLLVALQNADLPYRTNIVGVAHHAQYPSNGEIIELVPSHHMLGSVQVQVTCHDGYRVGYSSDFFWPVDKVIAVDELIVDSTYGDPLRTRQYNQETVDEKVVEVVGERARSNRSVALIGHNGRLQYALHLVADVIRLPVICSRRAFSPVSVYDRYGYHMPDVLPVDSPDAIAILRDHTPCLACITLPERRHLPWVDRFMKVTLSAHMTDSKHAVLDYGNGDCCIAFTDHADFDGTLAYIKATGARKVWTDPRSGDGQALARAVASRLGIKAQLAVRIDSRAWG